MPLASEPAANAAVRVLIVDDDAGLRRLLDLRLRAAGYEVATAEGAEAALASAAAFRPDVVLTDLVMGEHDGQWLLGELHRSWAGLPVILLTAHGTIPDAVRATQSGAFAFLTKPVDREELIETIDRAARLSAAVPRKLAAERLVTRSPRMLELLARARRAAAESSNVLITAESGAGKDVLARMVHAMSPRAGSALVFVNCGAVPETLLESELFGHEVGAFTGASRRHDGLFQRADGGTLVLDEIGDMPLAFQVKLLRVLEDRVVRPLGGTRARAVDVRVIASTHRDLRVEVAEGRFREDLFYRLNVIPLEVPPLRERLEDVPILVDQLLERWARGQAGPRPCFSPEAMERLAAHSWPGNVRQLANVVEQCSTLATGPVIQADAVERALGTDGERLPPLSAAREEFVRHYLEALLRRTEGNVSQAARLAGRNRTDLYKLLARHGLDPRAFVP